MNYPINNMKVPAFITVKQEAQCSNSDCDVKIKVGETAFFKGSSGELWHSKCGDPSWKVEGTPYFAKKQVAIATNGGNKLLTVMLRFRKELTIGIADLPMMGPILQKLLSDHLIQEAYKGYSITPRGFEWLEENGYDLHGEKIDKSLGILTNAT
jgi:hypothetical protein